MAATELTLKCLPQLKLGGTDALQVDIGGAISMARMNRRTRKACQVLMVLAGWVQRHALVAGGDHTEVICLRPPNWYNKVDGSVGITGVLPMKRATVSKLLTIYCS